MLMNIHRGDYVQIWYRPSLRVLMPLHGAVGAVCGVGRPRRVWRAHQTGVHFCGGPPRRWWSSPRNIGVGIRGRLYAVSAGNLRPARLVSCPETRRQHRWRGIGTGLGPNQPPHDRTSKRLRRPFDGRRPAQTITLTSAVWPPAAAHGRPLWHGSCSPLTDGLASVLNSLSFYRFITTNPTRKYLCRTGLRRAQKPFPTTPRFCRQGRFRPEILN